MIFFKKILNICNEVICTLIINIPGGLGVKLRYIYYKNKFKSCGKNLNIDVGVHFTGLNLISIGDNVYIDKYCIISTGEELIGNVTYKTNKEFDAKRGEILIGSDIHIAQFCIIIGFGGLVIEDKVVLSANTKLYSHTNTAYNLSNKSEVISLMPYSSAPFLNAPIILKKNVWLGLNTIVMPNVVIGVNSFSASNSLIMNSFYENSYIVGQPALKLKERFE